MGVTDVPSEELAGSDEETLQKRARELALAPLESGLVGSTDVLLVRIRNERYAVELRMLQSVQRSDGLTRVPCTPAHIAGILNVRGEVVTLIDPAVVLGLDERGPADDAAVVLLVQLSRGRVGLLVDEVIGIGQIDVERLAPSFSGDVFTLGIDEGTTILLDLEHFLTPDRLDVQEHVG